MSLNKAYLIVLGSFFVPKNSQFRSDQLEPLNEYSTLLKNLFLEDYKLKGFKIFRFKSRLEIEFLGKRYKLDVYLYNHEKIYLLWFMIPLSEDILEDDSNLQVILQAPVFKWKEKLMDASLLFSQILDSVFSSTQKELLLLHKLLYIISPFTVERLISEDVLKIVFSENKKSLKYASFTGIIDFSNSILVSRGEILDRSIIELYSFVMMLYSFLLTYEEIIIHTFPRLERDIKETIRASVLKVFFSRKLKHVASEITSARISLNYELFMERKFEKRIKQTVHYPLYATLKEVFEIEEMITKIETEINFLFEMYNVALSIHNEKQLYALKLLMFIIVILEIMMKVEGFI